MRKHEERCKEKKNKKRPEESEEEVLEGVNDEAALVAAVPNN
ncbi:unnamed protein product [Amoebophrya sp. A120]|nr:unnamed protein product [Amoebophrya sp. A120]|eukprot:GSA120T00012354001.1